LAVASIHLELKKFLKKFPPKKLKHNKVTGEDTSKAEIIKCIEISADDAVDQQDTRNDFSSTIECVDKLEDPRSSRYESAKTIFKIIRLI